MPGGTVQIIAKRELIDGVEGETVPDVEDGVPEVELSIIDIGGVLGIVSPFRAPLLRPRIDAVSPGIGAQKLQPGAVSFPEAHLEGIVVAVGVGVVGQNETEVGISPGIAGPHIRHTSRLRVGAPNRLAVDRTGGEGGIGLPGSNVMPSNRPGVGNGQDGIREKLLLQGHVPLNPGR